MYLYAHDPYKVKYQFLINKREVCLLITVLKHFNDSKPFIEYSNDMNHIYNNLS